MSYIHIKNIPINIIQEFQHTLIQAFYLTLIQACHQTLFVCVHISIILQFMHLMELHTIPIYYPYVIYISHHSVLFPPPCLQTYFILMRVLNFDLIVIVEVYMNTQVDTPADT